ncbi:sensor histidine kinase [Staphylococcus massiliensis]|uniref:sensor histidine kinase n=1 Tax=Staphylococcus massiliensis TaxID=555791 RepID=UPI001EDEC0A2|nr:HAMP domain-containing sensor histidine kinase [Staphylococcus massiliensis]MCG3399213.1 HAMP domain-containing histidine kinase [Staphylococcus massiliensis]
MNKRLTWTFIKYLALFFITTVILSVVVFFILLFQIVYSQSDNIEIVDEMYFEFNVDKKDGAYQISKDFKDNLREENLEFYLINDKGKELYPKKGRQLKERIATRYHSTRIMPWKKNVNGVIISKKAKPVKVKNLRELDTTRIIKSLYIRSYNPEKIYLENNKIKFHSNELYTPFEFKDNSTGPISSNKPNEMKAYKIMILTLVGALVINILLASLIAFLISLKLSKPLKYYLAWIENLSEGKLYKPGNKTISRRSKKLYRELDYSITELNQKLVQDSMYRSQINYYKQKWLGQMSHDLKSPLTSIYGYAKILTVKPEMLPQYNDLIIKKAEYMNGLIESLNENFKSETSQMAKHKEKFSIEETINRITTTIQYDQIEVVNHTSDMHFYGNQLYIERMLMNLIENSIEHNIKHPYIKIELFEMEHGIQLHYYDDGKGIKDFELASTENKTTKVNHESHGLGFSVILDAVKFHDGHFENIETERGVHFKITLKSAIE